MVQILLVGLGAGAASALLFASMASGALLSILLFYLSPLPILIAALGWTHWTALVAAISAATALGLGFGYFFFIAFIIGIGLPAWWLGYLTLLARPEPNAPDGIEWYPVGRLVFWAAILGALVVLAAIPTFGFDEETFRNGLRSTFERMLRAQTRTASDAPLNIPGVEASKLVDFLAAIIPLAAAVLTTLTNIANLWLAARIVKISGRLRRPWPDLSTIEFPAGATVLLGLAMLGSFLSTILGSISGIIAVSLLIAYGLLGFAVLHSITRGRPARSFTLGATYAAVLIFGWPVLLLSLLGLADTIFDLRGRAARQVPPSAPDPQ